MAKKLSSLFFSSIKKMARLQRQALTLASVKPIKRARKKTLKRLAVAKAAPAPARLMTTGAGTLQNLAHKTVPSATELLGRLTYSIYLPNTRPIAGMPLVVMLHGCQQTAHEMALGSRMNRLADSKGFVVLYPQQTRVVQALRCWRWFEADAGHGLAEADAIASLVEVVVKKYKLDANRVYVAGLSAGASMAGLTALRHPQLFAAVAMHSGAVLGDAHNAASAMKTMRRGSLKDPAPLVESLVNCKAGFFGMPALILQGQHDHLVAPLNARQLAQQFVHVNWAFPNGRLVDAAAVLKQAPEPAAKAGVLAAGTEREYQRKDYLRGGKVVVRLCMIKNIGHAWSGGDARFQFHAQEGPKASLLIWQFFCMHRRGQQ